VADEGEGRAGSPTESTAKARTWPTPAGARTAAIFPGRLTVSPLAARLREWLRAEAGDGRLLPWVPIAFGIGIALYFSADREPVAWVDAVLAVVLFGVAFLLRHRKAFVVALMLAATAGGFAVAALKTAPGGASGAGASDLLGLIARLRRDA
jgi:competence protein ComEC